MQSFDPRSLGELLPYIYFIVLALSTFAIGNIIMFVKKKIEKGKKNSA